ncbi:MAG: M15 family metallopeptidase [Lachnospiraceae bacterium]|nr:M15 family metallopeptidase [Lachnospiraceae bacterium]
MGILAVCIASTFLLGVDSYASSATGKIEYAEGFSSEPVPAAVAARITGISYPVNCPLPMSELRYLRLRYVDYSGSVRDGELICNKAIAKDLLEIFAELYNNRYPIAKIRLVDEYGGDDTLSITDDNTSCFNYRLVEGSTSLSRHALGMAIDINPFYNPYVTYPNGMMRVSPAAAAVYADRSQAFPHKIAPGDLCYKLFKAHGFKWGGDWKTVKDYQHFFK